MSRDGLLQKLQGDGWIHDRDRDGREYLWKSYRPYLDYLDRKKYTLSIRLTQDEGIAECFIASPMAEININHLGTYEKVTKFWAVFSGELWEKE